MAHLEIVGHIVVFASWSTEQCVILGGLCLVRRWRLGVGGFFKGVTLSSGLILGVGCHLVNRVK